VRADTSLSSRDISETTTSYGAPGDCRLIQIKPFGSKVAIAFAIAEGNGHDQTPFAIGQKSRLNIPISSISERSRIPPDLMRISIKPVFH
jgi:hypothetical protein